MTMTKTKLMICNEELTNDWLRKTAAASEKIPLIKALRDLTGWGLKECKDGVEQNCFIHGSNLCSPDATVNYFAPWMNEEHFKTVVARNEKVRKEMDKRQDEYNKQRIQEEKDYQARLKRQQEEQKRTDAARERELDKKETERIVSGIQCVCDNWKTLGFADKYNGCKAIMRNFNPSMGGWVPDLS